MSIMEQYVRDSGNIITIAPAYPVFFHLSISCTVWELTWKRLALLKPRGDLDAYCQIRAIAG